MSHALFLGCAIPARLPAYEMSVRAVLARLGVELVDLEFTCCGYTARHANREAFVFAAARNLAIAERAGADLLTACTCCYGTLRHAVGFLNEDAELRIRVARALEAEGCAWSGKAEVEHVIPLLAREIGIDSIAAVVSTPRTGLQVAAHYGCHALRPSNVARFDNPLAPTIFEALIRVTGATPVDWPRRLDCCGDPLHDANTLLSERMTQAKIADAFASGAEFICTACPHCHLRFDSAVEGTPDPPVRALLYTQLLGLALGLPADALGL